MGLYGVLVVTAPGTGPRHRPTLASATTRTSPLLLSEIDPVQNNAVADAVGTRGLQRDEGVEWTGRPMRRRAALAHGRGRCGQYLLSAGSQLRPALLPGQWRLVRPRAMRLGAVAFHVRDRRALGQVLVRFVNAGLRMHAPSIVGAQTGAAVSASHSSRKTATCSRVRPGCRATCCSPQARRTTC